MPAEHKFVLLFDALELLKRFHERLYYNLITDYLNFLSGLIPIAFAIPQFRKLTGELKLITAYLIIGILCTTINSLMAKYQINNLNVLNLFTWFETFVFLHVLGKWLNSKTGYNLAQFCFVCFSIYFLYTFQLNQFNTGVEIFAGIIVVCLSSYLLFRMSINTKEAIYMDFRFWFSFSIMLLLGINIVTLGLHNYLFSNDRIALSLTHIIYVLFSTFTHCMFAYGFICYKRKMKSYLPSLPSAH